MGPARKRSSSERKAMFRRMRNSPRRGTPDLAANDPLVRGLVTKRLARMGLKPGSRPDLTDELMQEGRIALWKAQKNYRSNRGAKFSTLAHRHVEGALGRTLKKQGVISVGERAVRKGVKRPDLAPLGAVDDPMERRHTSGGIGAADARLELGRLKKKLSPRDWQVLSGSAEHSQGQIAKKLGISKTRVNQVLKEARRKAG
jgi:RNA polymerase sigma factor (sigma-70 family)